MNKEEQNILKWACLLHDIVKQGSPIFEGKDHVHPFMGGKTTLEVFHSLGLIITDTPQLKEEFSTILELIEKSKQ